MKGEVKGAKEIANKETNQTKNSLARLLWGYSDHSATWALAL